MNNNFYDITTEQTTNLTLSQQILSEFDISGKRSDLELVVHYILIDSGIQTVHLVDNAVNTFVIANVIPPYGNSVMHNNEKLYIKMLLPNPNQENKARQLDIRIKLINYYSFNMLDIFDFDIYEPDGVNKTRLIADIQNNQYKSNAVMLYLTESVKLNDVASLFYMKIRNDK